MRMSMLAAADPLEHVVQHNILAPGGVVLLSNQIIMQVVAALLLLYFLPRFVWKRAGPDEVGRLVPTGWGNVIEVICVGLRDHVARPALGPHTDRFVPYIWSVFFFVLTCNMLGMIPLMDWTKPVQLLVAPNFKGYVLGGTATGNIWVTATLACCTLFMIVYNGLRLHGMGYIKHFFMGPPGLNLLIAFLEVVGLAAKIFALSVRLFVNMLAGHVMLAVIVGFVAGAVAVLGVVPAIGIAIPVILGGTALFFLELFVSFLQAFIFTFLSAMFIGQAVNIEHEHEHEHEHGAAHETAHEHAVPAPAGAGH